MNRGRRERTEEWFHRLVDLDAGARAGRLAELSAEDPELSGELASLLAAHEGEGVLDRLTSSIAPPPVGAAAPAAELTGTSIGHYEVGELVGRGGMGDVYRARDTRLDRDVALKFLPAWLSRDPSARDRFLVEARIVSSLDHPNVCTLLEIGETDDGRLFLIMPFYEGESLKRRLARGALPPEEAVRIALQTVRGLAAAHERGVVHRDVKPANLLLTEEGRVKILDFGVAKLVDVSLTRPGQTPGTALYMSPEQAAGGEVDARSDLWSLGVVLHEMLTGERPYDAERPGALRTAAREAPPEAPERLAGIVDRLLSPDPDDRYPDAPALANDLAACLATGWQTTARRRDRAPSFGIGRTRPYRRLLPVVVAIAAGIMFSRHAERWMATPSTGYSGQTPALIAVLPFEVDGETVEGSGDGLAALLSSGLDGVPGLRAVDQSVVIHPLESAPANVDDVSTLSAWLGTNVGARFVVAASAVELADQIRLAADIWEGDRRLGRVDVASPADSLLPALDRLVADIVRRLPSTTDVATTIDLASVSTRSLPALRSFLRAETLYRRLRMEDAIPLYRQAVAADSTFAVAWMRLAGAYGWTGRFADAEWAGAHARRFIDRLTERDSIAFEADAATGTGKLDVVPRLEDEVLRRPEDAELWYLLGEVYLHLGLRGGYSPAQAAAAFERAATLRPDMGVYRYHLIDLQTGFFHDSAAAHRLLNTLRALSEDPGETRYREILLALAFGDAADRETAMAAIDTLPRPEFIGTGFSLSHPRLADVRLRVDEALARRGRPRAGGPRLSALHALGRLDDVFEGMMNPAGGAPERACDLYFHLISEISVPDSLVRRVLEAVEPRAHMGREAACHGGYAADNGHWERFDAWTDHLDERAAAADAEGDSLGVRRLRATRELLRAYGRWGKEGFSDEVIGLFSENLPHVDRADPRLIVAPVARWWTAVALRERGHATEAAHLYDSFGLETWVPARLAAAETRVEAGAELEAARRDFRVVIEAWADTDPRLQPFVDRARAGLARLGE